VGAKRRLPTDKHLDGDMIQASKRIYLRCAIPNARGSNCVGATIRRAFMLPNIVRGVFMSRKTMIASPQ
jgi:hypothetical protein